MTIYGCVIFHVLSCSVSYCCAWWILSGIVIILSGKWVLVALPFFISGLCTVCYGLFALPLSVIGRLCSVKLPGHLVFYFT